MIESNPISADSMLSENQSKTNTHDCHSNSHGTSISPEKEAMVGLVMENLVANMRSALSYLQGPLKSTLQSSLHNVDKLPNIRLSQLAAEAGDLLHEAKICFDPGTLILADHFLGYMSSKCLVAAVDRGIPDILVDGPKSLQQLSSEGDARSDRLGQIMRVLYNNGIFDYDQSTGLYSNNHTSSLLQTDHWTQWRSWVELYGNQFYDIARGIPDSTKCDSVAWAAKINYDTDLDMFSYFQQQGWVPLLHKTLGGGAIAQAPGILEDYPWHEIADETVMDIGGGGGALVASLLRRFESMRGGVYDLSAVISHIRPFFHGEDGAYADVGKRVSPLHLISGDFFTWIPASKVYTMKWCLHDWQDHDAMTILSNIRKAIISGPKSRLIVLESILADGHSKRLSRYGDINMMMTANGQERTEKQWKELAGASGWEISAIYPLRGAWVQALEFIPNSKGYVMGHDSAEIDRLTAQHQWIKASMGSLIVAPINPKKQGMKILDSGTADGRWLMDISDLFPESTTYIGTDIAPHLFPSKARSSLQFFEQSVTDVWPQDWKQSFDLVHQRLVLAACDPKSSKDVIAALFAMVKPGGWIQLLECDHSGGFTDHQKAQHPATVKFGDLVTRAMAASGKSGQHGLSLKKWLREVGAVDVIETRLDCPIGARAATIDLKESTKNNLLSVVKNLKAARKDILGLGTEEDFDKLHDELSKELSEGGSTQRFHLVYGRRSNISTD